MSNPFAYNPRSQAEAFGMPEFANREDAYRAGLAEGFRQGVEKAADLAAQPFSPAWPEFLRTEHERLADRIRALRPEGDKT